MGNVIEFIKGNFSGYTVVLILISTWILIFMDRRQLERVGLKKEARFSLAAGVVYASIALVTVLIGIMTSAR